MSDYSKIIHVLCAIKPLVLPKDAFIYLDKEITNFSVSQGPLGVQFTFLYWSLNGILLKKSKKKNSFTAFKFGSFFNMLRKLLALVAKPLDLQ